MMFDLEVIQSEHKPLFTVASKTVWKGNTC